MDRDGLADFLRRRRDALRPEDVGLPPGVRRRAAGLRREEVAALAGMSADYLSRLEQRRAPQPSEQLLAALARALRLTLDERDHLFRLAGRTAPRRLTAGTHVRPALARVFDRLEDTPALILSSLAETLAQNRLATALLGDETRFAGLSASAFHRWFADPDARAHYPERDHAAQSRTQAAGLRAALDSGERRADAQRIVQDLLRRSPEFAAVWERHEVARRFEDSKTLVHPEVGEIEIDCQALFTEGDGQVLLVLTPRPGSPAVDQLALLGVLGQERFA